MGGLNAPRTANEGALSILATALASHTVTGTGHIFNAHGRLISL